MRHSDEMPSATIKSPPTRSSLRILRIRSPLTQVGYGLPAGTAHLLLLATGAVRIVRKSREDASEIEGPRLIWLADGEGAEMIMSSGTRGTLVSIPIPRIVPTLPSPPLGDQFRRTLGRDLNMPLPESDGVGSAVDALEAELAPDAPGGELAQTHVLGLLMIRLWRLAGPDPVAHGGAPQGLAERFLRLAASRRHDHWTVGRYAEELQVSRDRLGFAVRQATGLSPQAYVHRLLARDASELLTTTGMPIADIAFRLGFSDPAYFSRFFSRVVGSSPARFRSSARRRQQLTEEPYAAWP